MIANHEKDQAEDDTKKEFCTAEIAKTEDEEKVLKGAVADAEADISEQRDSIATTASEIEALQAGLAALDKSVAEATENRKKEHEEYVDSAAMNQATVELLGMAKNRMNKFYNPTLYKAPEPEPAEEFFAQVAIRRAGQPGPPPETFEGEYKKSDSGSGVVAMMDEMVRDVEKDMAEGKRDEEEAQKDMAEGKRDEEE